MALIDSAPRVREYTLTEGTGTIVLNQPRSHGALRFSDVMVTNDVCDIVIAYDGQFEELRVTLNASGNLVVNSVYYALHTGGVVNQSRINWGPGRKTVIMTASPAIRNSVRHDIPQGLSAGQRAIVQKNLPIMFAPIGTRMTFNNSTVPIGWVKDTSRNDYGFRLVTGNVGQSGSVNYSALHARTATDSRSLTTAMLASHGHGATLSNAPNHQHQVSSMTPVGPVSAGDGGHGFGSTPTLPLTSSNGGHGHNLTINTTGSGAGFNMGIDMRVRTVDLIIGVRQDS